MGNVASRPAPYRRAPRRRAWVATSSSPKSNPSCPPTTTMAASRARSPVSNSTPTPSSSCLSDGDPMTNAAVPGPSLSSTRVTNALPDVTTCAEVASKPASPSLATNSPREPRGSFVMNTSETPCSRSSSSASIDPGIVSDPIHTTPSRSTIRPSNGRSFGIPVTYWVALSVNLRVHTAYGPYCRALSRPPR
jgi:hypothetical protein